MIVKVKGIKTVINRWNRTNKGVGRRAARGLKAGSKFLYDKSQELVPVDKGDLKRSGYYRNIGKRSGMGAIYAIGYTSDYAVWVHEDTRAAHGKAFNIKYASEIASSRYASKRPEERSKYLSYPARKYKRTIRRIIAKNAKL